MSVDVIRRILVALLVVVTSGATSGWVAAEQDGGRKTTKRVAPAYPESANRLQLTGTVRLVALVAADGRVTGTQIIGGHPILIRAVTEAVMRWTYRTADRESREHLVFNFAPR
jgi:outer membrane biosynthesis protein TonB